MFMVGLGQTPVADVAEGMIDGEVMAFQYHKEGYEDPKWQISLGFVSDVEHKNDVYAGKKKEKKPASKRKPTAKRPLIG